MPRLQEKLTETQRNELTRFIRQKQRSKQEACRAQVVLLLNDRSPAATIEALTGFRRRQQFRLRMNYLVHGLETLKDARKGEPKVLLTKRQLAEIVALVKQASPKHVDPGRYREELFWTTNLLGDYIERTYSVKYKSRTSLYLIFRGAKFTYHKPGRIYEKHHQGKVDRWKEDNETKIFQALEEPNTVVLCEDEMILSTQTTFQKIWLPSGEFPRVEVSNTKKNRSVYGFLNLNTGQEHAFKTETQTMVVTADILAKIRRIYPTQKIFLIWDGAGWHRGSVAQRFIQDDGHIETLHFPSYAPELNPQEHVWKSGRTHVTHNRFIDNIDTTTDEFVEWLNTHKFGYSLLGFSAVS